MAISQDLFMAILAMDSYNRVYNEGIKVAGSQIGTAILGGYLADTNTSFFAQAYNWNGQTVISYRGTDQARPSLQEWTLGDAWNGPTPVAVGK